MADAAWKHFLADEAPPTMPESPMESLTDLKKRSAKALQSHSAMLKLLESRACVRVHLQASGGELSLSFCDSSTNVVHSLRRFCIFTHANMKHSKQLSINKLPWLWVW